MQKIWVWEGREWKTEGSNFLLFDFNEMLTGT